MSNIPFINLKQQYKELKDLIDSRIHAVLDHGQYINGPEVKELESKLADYVGVKHVITCANGTDALQLSLMAMGIGAGDIVFCPTFTFYATAEAIAIVGAIPVFVDSDPNTFNICTEDLEDKIKSNLKGSKAIISVDLFGLPANYPEIERIAEKYNLKLIEDAAQGFGGSIDGKRAGSFGDIATTSFFPAKPLGCYGDGGALFTNNDEYAEILHSLRVHGKGFDKYDNVRIGMNSRLDTIQAAVLLEKLAVFPRELEQRNELACAYEKALGEAWLTPKVPNGFMSSWAQYTLRSKERESVMEGLKSNNVPSMIYYGKCLHKQKAFSNLPDQSLPVAEKLSSEVFSIPMSPYVSEESFCRVISGFEK